MVILLPRGFKDVSVFRVGIEETAPGFNAGSLANDGGSGRVDEGVVVGHKSRQAIQVSRVDAVVEPKGHCGGVIHAGTVSPWCPSAAGQ